jgi:Fe-S cluster assembly iron-binding protein IscA
MTLTLTVPPKVTDRAFARLAEINGASGEEKALRIAVDGGGCSGFQYDIKLDDPTEPMTSCLRVRARRSWSTACPCRFLPTP